MRHVVHNLWPIFARVFPDWWQCVTFNAAMNEKISAMIECGKVDIAPVRRRDHFFGCRRRVVRSLAAEQETKRDYGRKR